MFATIQEDTITVYRTFQDIDIGCNRMAGETIRLMTVEDRKQYGIYPIETPFVAFDPFTQVEGESTFTFNGDAVIETRVIIDKPVEQVERETAEREKTTAQQELDTSDKATIRAIEDLIQALVGKGVLAITDLPSPVVTRLERRAELRTKIAK
jgi:hypothetical protein